MKLRKRLILLEDFKTKTTDASNIANVTEVPVNKTKNTSTRNEVIADVDAILTNLETLSAQITESALITEAGELEAVFKSIKSTWAIAKSSSMLKKFGELEQANNADLMAVKVAELAMKSAAELEKSGGDQSAEGKVKTAKAKAKMDVAKDKMETELEVEKERAKNELDAFNVELATAEEDISKDTALGRAYQATKTKVSSDVRLLGKTELAKQKMKAGNEKAAKDLAEEIKGIQKTSEDLAKKIADGNAEAGKDMKELAGIKAYVGEIDAIQKANQALGTIRAEAEKARESVVAESNILGFDLETILESTLTDLYSASKSRANVAGLSKAKELAAKFKQAGTAKIEAQRALADKIKGKEVTKTVIIIAGGDGDAAKEGENGYTLTTFIKSLGGGSDIIPAEEYATVKDAIEIEGEVDQAITDAEKSGGAKGKEDKKTLEDAITGFKDEISALKPEGGADKVKPQVKAALEVKQFQAELKLAELNGEDTAAIQTKLDTAIATAKVKPLPGAGGGGGGNDDLTDDQKERIKAEEDQIVKREREIAEEEAKDEPNQAAIDGKRKGIEKNKKDIADIKAEQMASLRINSKDLKIVSEASLSGLQSYDSEEDGYKWLKAEAKKMGVKLSVDKDPYGDGTDELNATGDKSALQKFAALTGHDQDLGTEEEGAVYVIKEAIKLDEGMSVAEKFAILMNR